LELAEEEDEAPDFESVDRLGRSLPPALFNGNTVSFEGDFKLSGRRPHRGRAYALKKGACWSLERALLLLSIANLHLL
jgi:hypothetical protein